MKKQMGREQLIDIDENQLKLAKKIIKNHIPDKTVWAYGSRVRWKAEEKSDMDLTVFQCDSTQISNLKEAFEESNLLISVDVISWEDISEKFKANIKKQYVVLQEKSTRPKDWHKVRLGEVISLIGGGTPKTSVPEYWNGNIPWLSVADFNNDRKYVCNSEKSITKIGLKKSSAKILHKGDIIISARGTVGLLSMVGRDMTFNQSCYGIRAKNKSFNEYIYYFLKNTVNELQHISHGGVFDTITRDTFNKIEVLLPPLHEQKAIAEMLSSLDDKIELLHRQNKTLEDMAQTIFRKWFIEDAKEDWEEGFIPDEFNFTMGLSPPGNTYNKEKKGLPMFQGNADFGFRFPQNRIYTTDPKRMAEPLDTLISVRAPVGEQNMAFEKSCIGRGVSAFRYKNDKNFYTYTYYKMKSLMNEIKQFNQTGTVFGSINKQDFNNFTIKIPPINIVKKFQNEVKSIDDKIIHNSVQSLTLKNTQDSLLPKLMSGAVKIKC